jgi:hypothetical protein
MGAALRLVNPKSGKTPISFEDFLERLSTREFDRVESKVRVMRETFQAPPTVRDHDEYHQQLLRFCAHYHNSFFGTDLTALQIEPFAWNHLRQLHKDLHGVERDAILNRNGGFIGIINQLTEELVKQQLDSYIDLVFFDYLPTDQFLNFRLAQEVHVYVQKWLKDPDLKDPAMYAGNITDVIKKLALLLHQLRHEWVW